MKGHNKDEHLEKWLVAATIENQSDVSTKNAGSGFASSFLKRLQPTVTGKDKSDKEIKLVENEILIFRYV